MDDKSAGVTRVTPSSPRQPQSQLLNFATNDMVAADQKGLGNPTDDNANMLCVSSYQLVRSSWFSVLTSSNGLLTLMDISSSGGLDLLVIETPDPLFLKARTVSRLARPGHSATTKHVDIPIVLLLMPLEIFDIPLSGRWSASRRLP